MIKKGKIGGKPPVVVLVLSKFAARRGEKKKMKKTAKTAAAPLFACGTGERKKTKEREGTQILSLRLLSIPISRQSPSSSFFISRLHAPFCVRGKKGRECKFTVFDGKGEGGGEGEFDTSFFCAKTSFFLCVCAGEQKEQPFLSYLPPEVEIVARGMRALIMREGVVVGVCVCV